MNPIHIIVLVIVVISLSMIRASCWNNYVSEWFIWFKSLDEQTQTKGSIGLLLDKAVNWCFGALMYALCVMYWINQ